MIQSAGILVYRRNGGKVEVLLAHPGGPFWAKKDVWSIPKGQLEEDEELISGARREFVEEIGVELPPGDLLPLGFIKQGSKKTNHIWTVEGEVDISGVGKHRDNNMVTMEWPPRSGKKITFAENDRAAWSELGIAKGKIFKDQQIFIERLAAELGLDLKSAPEPETPAQQSLI